MMIEELPELPGLSLTWVRSLGHAFLAARVITASR